MELISGAALVTLYGCSRARPGFDTHLPDAGCT